MSWMQKLYETYEVCVQQPHFVDPPQTDANKEVQGLMPVSHTSQQAHIVVTLDDKGAKIIRAELLPPKTQVVIPATEDSAGRAGKIPPPHPLMDKIRYCAKDYVGPQENFYELYEKQLKAWCTSQTNSHPKVQAIYNYISKGALVHDLLEKGILHADSCGALLTEAPEGSKDTVFKLLTGKKIGNATVRDQGDAFVIWSVESSGDLEPRTWRDKSLQEAWICYDANQMQQKSLCMVSGSSYPITTKHPRNIRRPGDGAKLISSNDEIGFTFRGRFLKPEEACTVGYEVSNKAHNALRWLIGRQGYRNGDQVVVAWATKGIDVPNPGNWQLSDALDFFSEEEEDVEIMEISEPVEMIHSDAGQAFSRRLAKALNGYKKNLEETDSVAVLALDSASPGRLSVIFYREQIAQDYLAKLQQWQEEMSWILPMKERDDKGPKAKPRTTFLPYAPLPETVARVAYGRRIDDKLRKATVERLLPCIVDGMPIPRDLVESCVRRACNRVGLEKWEWDEVLGVACAMYKGFYARHYDNHKRRTYTMGLDKERCTRDYLYGRLLAVAEYIERSALNQAGEKRPTNAERLMQRFADHPCSTWRDLEKQISPYMQRLQTRESSYWMYDKAKRVLQEICDSVTDIDDFTSPEKLDGEFLLGYHCQYSDLFKKNLKNQSLPTDQKGE